MWNDVLRVRYNRFSVKRTIHYSGVIMRVMASHILSVSIVYSSVWLGTEQSKHQSSASSAFERGIHRWPLNSLHKGPVMRKRFPFHDFIVSRLSMIIRSRHDWWELFANRLCTRAAALTARKCGQFLWFLTMVIVWNRGSYSVQTTQAQNCKRRFENCHEFI